MCLTKTKATLLRLLVSAGCIGLLTAGKAHAQDDVADVLSKEHFAGGDRNKRYFLIRADEETKTPPKGFNLVIVLPGGDGGPDFNTFVKRIYKNALSRKYLVAQLVAVKWTAGQHIVWPTNKTKVEKQEFSTEQFVKAVVEDIKGKYKLNEQKIFTLSWSSGGPAGYAISLQEEKSVTGSYIAMSVFKPLSLENLKQAAGHCYYIDHSPEDNVCPFWMAEKARDTLREHGAKTKLVTYDGGHGWRGNIYGRIRKGIRWLESAVREPAGRKEPVPTHRGTIQPANSLPVVDSFETGDVLPDGWKKGANVKGVKYIWDKRVASSGTASLCLKKTDKRFYPIAQWSRTFSHDGTPKTLWVNAKVKARQAAKAIIDVQFLDNDRQRLGHKWAVYIGAKNTGDPPADHDWQDYAGTVSLPKDTKAIVIALQIYGPGTVWFDELRAVYIDSEPVK